MAVGNVVEIPVGTPHRFTGLMPQSKLLEVSTQHFDEDSYRIEPGDSQRVP